MRYMQFVFILLILVFIVACGGKTTVRDEMIDTSPREESTRTPAQQPVEPPDQEVPEETPADEDTKPEPRPAPGTGDEVEPERPPVRPDPPPSPSSDPTERDSYMNNQLVYPNSQPSELMSSAPSSTRTSNITLLSDDSPDQVIAWYTNKFGNRASVNPSPYGTDVIINDSEKGYRSSVLVQQAGSQGKTLIVISVSDA